MTRRLLALLLAPLLVLGLPAPAAPPDPWAYHGIYTLDDGTVFHGGLLKEGDTDLWIFGNPDIPGVGGAYRQTSQTEFTSLLRPGQTLRFSGLADGSYQQLALETAGSIDRTGKRSGHIARRSSDLANPLPTP